MLHIHLGPQNHGRCRDHRRSLSVGGEHYLETTTVLTKSRRGKNFSRSAPRLNACLHELDGGSAFRLSESCLKPLSTSVKKIRSREDEILDIRYRHMNTRLWTLRVRPALFQWKVALPSFHIISNYFLAAHDDKINDCLDFSFVG